LLSCFVKNAHNLRFILLGEKEVKIHLENFGLEYSSSDDGRQMPIGVHKIKTIIEGKSDYIDFITTNCEVVTNLL